MTDHTFFNIPNDLKKGLIEVLALHLLDSQPDSAGGLGRRISEATEVWDWDSLKAQGLLLKELNHNVTLKDGKYYLTPAGKEVLADSLYEIAKFQTLCSTNADKVSEVKQ